MNYQELQDFIKAVAKSGATEVQIDSEDIKITIKTPPKGKQQETIVQQIPVPSQMHGMPMAAPIPAPVPAAPVTPAPAANAPVSVEEAPKEKEEDNNHITIKSPMVGTFYSRPTPEKPTFVNVGDQIEQGKVICILEAMKLFNEIESEVSGKIIKVLVEDGTPVEYDQPLFVVDPS